MIFLFLNENVCFDQPSELSHLMKTHNICFKEKYGKSLNYPCYPYLFEALHFVEIRTI